MMPGRLRVSELGFAVDARRGGVRWLRGIPDYGHQAMGVNPSMCRGRGCGAGSGGSDRGQSLDTGVFGDFDLGLLDGSGGVAGGGIGGE